MTHFSISVSVIFSIVFVLLFRIPKCISTNSFEYLIAHPNEENHTYLPNCNSDQFQLNDLIILFPNDQLFSDEPIQVSATWQPANLYCNNIVNFQAKLYFSKNDESGNSQNSQNSQNNQWIELGQRIVTDSNFVSFRLLENDVIDLIDKIKIIKVQIAVNFNNNERKLFAIEKNIIQNSFQTSLDHSSIKISDYSAYQSLVKDQFRVNFDDSNFNDVDHLNLLQFFPCRGPLHDNTEFKSTNLKLKFKEAFPGYNYLKP